MRSESEKSFDECQMRRARLQSLGLAYLSPQNKSLAQSFRYMRNKPTIIAFKTPSLESCDAKLSVLSVISRQVCLLFSLILLLLKTLHCRFGVTVKCQMCQMDATFMGK